MAIPTIMIIKVRQKERKRNPGLPHYNRKLKSAKIGYVGHITMATIPRVYLKDAFGGKAIHPPLL